VTRPTESNSRPPAVVWPPVDSGGLVPVLTARRQMVLLCGYDKWEAKLAFIGPLLFGSPSGYSGSFGYVPRVTVPRKVRLSLEELQKVANVKCELTFRAGSDAKKE